MAVNTIDWEIGATRDRDEDDYEVTGNDPREVANNIRWLSDGRHEDSINWCIMQNSRVIKYIDNPTVTMQYNAMYGGGQIGYASIKNPSDEAVMMILKENGRFIRYISNPTEKMQVVAVTNYAYSIKLIENPCEQAQVIAVSFSSYLLSEIKNPCPAAIAQSEKVKAV